MQGSKLPFIRWSLLLIFAAGQAHGDAGDVFNATVSQTFGYDSNLFKLANGADAQALIGSADRSDSYAASALRLTATKRVERQLLSASAGLTSKSHERFKRLDSNLRDYGLRWDWQIGHLWTGTLSASRSQVVPGFDDFRATERDIVTIDQTTARAALAFHADWRLVFAATSRRLAHSAEPNAYGDSRVDGSEAGLRYLPGSGREFGMRIRQADAAFPKRQLVNGLPVNNGYREDGLDFDAAWQTGGASRLRGTLGWVERRHRELAGRDHAGRTGSLGWDWTPTGKSSLGFSLRREISAQDDLLATYANVRAAVISAGWQPTAKLSVRATIERRQRTMDGDPVAVLSGLPARSDDQRTLSLGLGYAAMRDLQIQASWRAERRDSNMASFSYDARQYLLLASLTF